MAATSWKPAPPCVIIVGGGLAGLAAAVSLVGKDLDLILLESRPRLGGRAGSFTDAGTGELVDNCQHVSMGCCTNLSDFCRQVGIDSMFHRESGIVFLGLDNRISTLSPGKLPAPLHMLGSFWKLSFLTLMDKLRIARGLASLALDRRERPGETFANWLARHGQTPRTIDLFWSTVLVSALNERLDRMDVGHARKVFLDGFLATAEGSILEIPSAPLGEIYGMRMERWLQNHHVDLRLKTGVKSIELDDEGSVQGVTLRSGESIAADFVVATIPFDRVLDLLDERAREQVPGLSGVSSMESSPITGIHLWFDRPVCPLQHAVTVGRTVQWVFNHSLIQGADPAAGQYLQLVVSAARDLVGMENTAIRDMALAEIAAIWPEVKRAELLRWRVVTEHGATFTVSPGIEALRPPQRTPVEGFFLAGDWTDTRWPATMEGAVRSGYLAAEGILDDLGRPEQLLKPDLRPNRLARFLLRLKPTFRIIPGSARTRTILSRRHVPAE